MPANRQLYKDIATEANPPLRDRAAVAKGRGGKNKIARCYHLKPDEMITLKKKMTESGTFISPYGAGRIYTAIINSLVALGTGKAHPISLVFTKFEEICTLESTKDEDGKTMWDRFMGKSPRNEATARDPFAKFLQNIEVLQRLGGAHPYAFKLAQVGACINIYVAQNQQINVELKTGIPVDSEVKPINMNRQRKYTKTVDSVPSGTIVPDDK